MQILAQHWTFIEYEVIKYAIQLILTLHIAR
jgi:hypothetical protein